MDAIRFESTGGPEVLQPCSMPVPKPGPGQALVRHTAIGLNFIDTYHRSGLYPVELPSGLGIEAAGVVEAVGADVSEVNVGDRVAYASGPPGAYAEARAKDASELVPLPAGISDELAACTLLKGMTAEYLLRRAYCVQPGSTVLWHAAAGGVGLIAVQWLKRLGAEVIGTVGSREKAELARAHGCDHTIVYTEEDFVERVREITGGAGVPVVYDSVGRATFEGSLDCLQPRGMMISFGNASGKPEPLDVTALARRGSLFLTRPSLAAYTATRSELMASAGALFELLEGHAVSVVPHQRWPLHEAAAAHRALEARQTTGPSLLLP